jgi:hypothetical protein
MSRATYYVVRTGPDRFDLRQSRYVAQRANGREHPHDLMAQGFTAQGMREVLAKWFADTDTTALPSEANTNQ